MRRQAQLVGRTTPAREIVATPGRAVILIVDRVTIAVAWPSILTIKILAGRAIVVVMVRVALGDENAARIATMGLTLAV